MGGKQSQPQEPPKPEAEHQDLMRALNSYSKYEIGLYMQGLGLDVNRPPPDLSPMHHIVEKTNRLNILQFLVEEKHGNPLLEWNGHSLLRVACEKRKIFFVKYIMMRVPLSTGKKLSPVEGELLKNFGGETDLLKEMQTYWKHRQMSGRRMLFLLVAQERRGLPRLPQGLVAEIVQYI